MHTHCVEEDQTLSCTVCNSHTIIKDTCNSSFAFETHHFYTVLPLSFRPSKIFFVTFFSVTVDDRNLIFGHQASYRYTILWVAILDPSDSYFLFADLVGLYTHWTYMHIFRHIFLSNYWWQRSDIWSQASYRYPISWEAFLDPSDSYFLFAKERGYHKWALAHSSSCYKKE